MNSLHEVHKCTHNGQAVNQSAFVTHENSRRIRVKFPLRLLDHRAVAYGREKDDAGL
jgi:hypothetical protein